MTLGCARCGDCCESIWLHNRVVDLIVEIQENPHAVIGSATKDGEHNVTFLAEHWTLQRRSGDGAVFACDAYDADRRLCTAHDERPPVCRDFPWYSREPGNLGGGEISKRCSYWLDVPAAQRPGGVRPLIPLVAV